MGLYRRVNKSERSSPEFMEMEFGIAADGFRIEMPAVRARKRAMVSGLNDVYRENFNKTGAEFILASGPFVGPRTVGRSWLRFRLP